MPAMSPHGGHPHGSDDSGREPSPYVELDRAAWAALALDAESPLTPDEIDRLRGLGDALDLDEVQQVYLPLSRLLSLYVESAGAAAPPAGGVPRPAAAAAHAVRDRPGRLGRRRQVHDGARAAADAGALARAPQRRAGHHRRLPLPQRRARRRGLLERKGFPESYDRRALLRFVVDIKSGKDEVEAPIYSHLVYDVVPDEKVVIKRPDIVIIEGLNVLQPARSREDGRTGLAVSDFFDFSVYVDAGTGHIRDWYVERFLRLRETAFRDPESYFARYAAFSQDEAVAEAERIWDTINGPNLVQNILPTRSRATLVLRKDRDHSVRYVRLRKL